MGLFDMPSTRTRLSDIVWKETSGVDHPANLEEGWAIMKAATLDNLDLDQLAKLLDEDEEEVQKSGRLSEALSGVDWESAPGRVRDAARVLRAWTSEKTDTKKAEGEDSRSLTRRLLGYMLRQADTAEQRAAALATAATAAPAAKSADDKDEEALLSAIAESLPSLFEELALVKRAGDSQVRAAIGRAAIARFEQSVRAKTGGAA